MLIIIACAVSTRHCAVVHDAIGQGKVTERKLAERMPVSPIPLSYTKPMIEPTSHNETNGRASFPKLV
jgi:hypothetical protein